MFEVISISIEGSDFDNITMGAESIKVGAQNIQLSEMQKIAEKMLSCAAAQYKEGCLETFEAMQAYLLELKKAL